MDFGYPTAFPQPMPMIPPPNPLTNARTFLPYLSPFPEGRYAIGNPMAHNIYPPSPPAPVCVPSNSHGRYGPVRASPYPVNKREKNKREEQGEGENLTVYKHRNPTDKTDVNPPPDEIEKLDTSHLSRVQGIFQSIVSSTKLLGATTRKATAMEGPWRKTRKRQSQADDDYASADVAKEPVSNALEESDTARIEDFRLKERFLSNQIDMVKAMLGCTGIVLEVGERTAFKKQKKNASTSDTAPTDQPNPVVSPREWMQYVNRDVVFNTKYRRSLVDLEKGRQDLNEELEVLQKQHASLLRRLEDIEDLTIEREWSLVDSEGEDYGGEN